MTSADATDIDPNVEVDTSKYDAALEVLDELRTAYLKAEAHLHAGNFPDAYHGITVRTPLMAGISGAIGSIRSSKRSAITIAGMEARLAPRSIADLRMEGGIFGAQTTEITGEMLGHPDA